MLSMSGTDRIGALGDGAFPGACGLEPGAMGGGGMVQPSLCDKYDTIESASPRRQIWASAWLTESCTGQLTSGWTCETGVRLMNICGTEWGICAER